MKTKNEKYTQHALLAIITIMLVLVIPCSCSTTEKLTEPHPNDYLIINKTNNKLIVLKPGYKLSDTTKWMATTKINCGYCDSLQPGNYLILLNEYRNNRY